MSRLKLAVVMVVGVVALSAAQFLYIFSPPQSDLILRLAQAQVVEHNDGGAAAQALSRFDALGAAVVPELAFAPVWPMRLPARLYRTLSARPVTLLGREAVLVRLLDQQGRRLSLFIMPADELLRPLHNRQQRRGEWLLEFWLEDGGLYTLIRAAPG